MSIKFYKKLIVVVYTLILLIPTIVVGIFMFDFKIDLKDASIALDVFSDAIIVNEVVVEDSGIMEVYINDGKRKPLIIVQHAINARKEDVIKSAYSYAEAGYFVIAPDLYAHGNRKKIDSRELVMQGVVYTSESYDAILEYYIGDERCNIDKFGMTGYSLGGMVVFHYATYGRYKPTAIAPCISTPEWESLEDTYLLNTIIPTGDTSIEGDEDKLSNARRVLSDNSPIKDYKNMQDIHILMQNGREDTVILPEGITELYYLLEPLGTDIRVMVHEGQGHVVPDNNILNIINFFDETLK